MFLFAWILATSFFIYLSFRVPSIFAKIILSVLVFAIQTVLLFGGYIGFMFDDWLGYAVAFLLLPELLICSLYKLKNISYKCLLSGIIALGILGIWQYYSGSVIGEMLYRISDAGGMHRKLPYAVYRWSTYILDVLYPWFIICNTIISPFWHRLPTTENYWLKLIHKLETS